MSLLAFIKEIEQKEQWKGGLKWFPWDIAPEWAMWAARDHRYNKETNSNYIEKKYHQ